MPQRYKPLFNLTESRQICVGGPLRAQVKPLMPHRSATRLFQADDVRRLPGEVLTAIRAQKLARHGRRVDEITQG